MKTASALLTSVLIVIGGYSQVSAGIATGLTLEYETEITELNLGGTFPLPLGSNFSIVQSQLTLSESPNFESTGHATAIFAFRPGGGEPNTPDEIQDGDAFFVDSFFDVFFDITVTDVDPANDFDPLFGGSALSIPSDGTAARMQLGGKEILPQADTSKPNFGLFPLEGDIYLGHVDVVIPLPFSVGGDPAENDVLKFEFSTHSVGDVSATFLVLADGTVVENFDSSAPFAGSIFDESVDPPFGPFTLTGPTTTTSLGPQPAGLAGVIPEPGSALMWALLTIGAIVGSRRPLRRRMGR